MSLHDLGLMVLLLAPAMLMSVLFLITMASEDFSDGLPSTDHERRDGGVPEHADVRSEDGAPSVG